MVSDPQFEKVLEHWDSVIEYGDSLLPGYGEDIAQEVFLAVHRGRMPQTSNHEPWLYGLARQVARSESYRNLTAIPSVEGEPVQEPVLLDQGSARDAILSLLGVERTAFDVFFGAERSLGGTAETLGGSVLEARAILGAGCEHVRDYLLR